MFDDYSKNSLFIYLSFWFHTTTASRNISPIRILISRITAIFVSPLVLSESGTLFFQTLRAWRDFASILNWCLNVAYVTSVRGIISHNREDIFSSVNWTLYILNCLSLLPYVRRSRCTTSATRPCKKLIATKKTCPLLKLDLKSFKKYLVLFSTENISSGYILDTFRMKSSKVYFVWFFSVFDISYQTIWDELYRLFNFVSTRLYLRKLILFHYLNSKNPLMV